MKIPSRRRLFFGIAILGAAIIAFILFLPPYSAKFEHPSMIGLTKGQVVARVGNPTSIIKNEDVWSYQIGMDPDVTISFTDGRVVDVDIWKK